jgi:hypothetical protein
MSQHQKQVVVSEETQFIILFILKIHVTTKPVERPEGFL